MSTPPPNSLSQQPESVGWLTGGKLVVIALLTLVSWVVLSAPTIPLGIPGEWTWARRALAEIDPLEVIRTLSLCGGYWTAIVWRERNHKSPVVLCVIAFLWLNGVLYLQPDVQGLSRAPTVLYYKRTEGYFWQAAFEVEDSKEFLAGYRAAISTGNDPDRYLHIGTHPPGLTLGYRALLSLFQSSPALTNAVIRLEPVSMKEAFEALGQFPTPKGEFTRENEATLWTATLLTLLAVAGACWPIYRLTARMSDPITAWRAAAIWPLVPSLVVFFPKSDLFCPMLATMSCWLWLEGWSRLSLWRCVLAGMGFFCGLMITLALAPVALLLVIQTILERWTRKESFRERTAMGDIECVLAALLGFVVSLSALSIWGTCNLAGVWLQNLKNHGMFYDHNSRTYLGWLALNPIEAAIALGVPLACCAAMGLVRAWNRRSQTAVNDGPAIAFSQGAAWFAVWSILWLSGKNMGEAARLWIFLAPWPVMTALVGLSRVPASAAPSPTSSLYRGSAHEKLLWRMLLILQVITCLWTMWSVDGFHFAELMPE